MKQITIRQLVRQSKSIEEWLPFELVRDGVVIAVVSSPNVAHDVIQSNPNTPRAGTMSHNVVGELYRYSSDWK